MGRAAEIAGITQAFLRGGLDTAQLLTPQRSDGADPSIEREQVQARSLPRPVWLRNPDQYHSVIVSTA